MGESATEMRAEFLAAAAGGELLSRGPREVYPWTAAGLGALSHWAAIGGHGEAVKFLVARGARPQLRDARFDADVAGWAHEGGHQELAAWLMSEAAG